MTQWILIAGLLWANHFCWWSISISAAWKKWHDLSHILLQLYIMSPAALQRVFYWCCLFPKAGSQSLWVAGHGWEKSSLTQATLFCTVIFLCVMGSLKRIRNSRAPLQQRRVFYFAKKKACAALSGNSLKGKKKSPIWCLYHLLLLLSFLFLR